MIAVILVVITAVEVATSYLEGSVNDYIIIGLLVFFAIVKFTTVESCVGGAPRDRRPRFGIMVHPWGSRRHQVCYLCSAHVARDRLTDVRRKAPDW